MYSIRISKKKKKEDCFHGVVSTRRKEPTVFKGAKTQEPHPKLEMKKPNSPNVFRIMES